MLSDVYFVDLQMTGLHWIYTMGMLFAIYTLNQILTVHIAPDIKKWINKKADDYRKTIKPFRCLGN